MKQQPVPAVPIFETRRRQSPSRTCIYATLLDQDTVTNTYSLDESSATPRTRSASHRQGMGFPSNRPVARKPDGSIAATIYFVVATQLVALILFVPLMRAKEAG